MGQSIDAECVRPAPVGRVTDWTFRPQGSDPVRWDWSLGPPDVRGLRPIRNPRSTERSRHIPVQAHCFVTGTTLKLESGLEYDLLLMLERDPDAAWFVPQPARLGVRLPNGRRTIHTPDLLMLDSAGRVRRRHVGTVAAALRPRAVGGAVIAVERGFALESVGGDVRHQSG